MPALKRGKKSRRGRAGTACIPCRTAKARCTLVAHKHRCLRCREKNYQCERQDNTPRPMYLGPAVRVRALSDPPLRPPRVASPGDSHLTEESQASPYSYSRELRDVYLADRSREMKDAQNSRLSVTRSPLVTHNTFSRVYFERHAEAWDKELYNSSISSSAEEVSELSPDVVHLPQQGLTQAGPAEDAAPDADEIQEPSSVQEFSRWWNLRLVFTAFFKSCSTMAEALFGDDDQEPSEMYDQILEMCPTLLATCCCIALHLEKQGPPSPQLVSLTAHVYSQIMNNLFHPEQSEGFLIAVLLIAIYSREINCDHYLFDTWLITNAAFRSLETLEDPSWSQAHQEIWNGLVYTQLVHSNERGYDVSIFEKHIDICRRQNFCNQNGVSVKTGPLLKKSVTSEVPDHSRKTTTSLMKDPVGAWSVCMQIAIEIQWAKHWHLRMQPSFAQYEYWLAQIAQPSQLLIPRAYSCVIQVLKFSELLLVKWCKLCSMPIYTQQSTLLHIFFDCKDILPSVPLSMLLELLEELRDHIKMSFDTSAVTDGRGYVTSRWYVRLITLNTMSMVIGSSVLPRISYPPPMWPPTVSRGFIYKHLHHLPEFRRHLQLIDEEHARLVSAPNRPDSIFRR